jgi:ABC-type sugar transport system substrate-binding protein
VNRKISIILTIAMLLTGCCGCAKAAVSGQSSAGASAQEDSNAGYITVGFCQVGSESDWRIACSNSYKEEFTEVNGYRLLFADGEGKQENQIKSMREFILQDVDYILLDPIVETGWDAVLKEAKSAGIPVIICDREVKTEEDGLYECWIGSDFEKEGRNAGKWLADYLQSKGRDQEKINIVTIQGTMGSSAQLGRTKGFGDVLKEHANWTMLGQESGDFTQAKGQEVMEDFLRKYHDIDVVISENDNMTFGAVNAIQAAGKTCGRNGDIVIISFDAVKTALQSMIDGNINADFECNPLLAPLVEKDIEKLQAGESLEKVQYIDETYFDDTMDLKSLITERKY